MTGNALAATLYWNGVGTGWNLTVDWSTNSGATTPNPAAVPGASDDVVFNITTVTAAQTVNLNANQAAQSLTFNSTGTTAILGGGTNRTMGLGAGGITVNAGVGAVTIGSATSGQNVDVVLAASQTWTNNASGTLTINNGIDNGANSLTIGGSGATTIAGVIGNGATFSGGLTKTGSGTLTLNGSAVSKFTGGLIVNNGTVALNFANLASPTNLVDAANSLMLGGGTFSLLGKNVAAATTVQTFNGGTTFNAGRDLILTNKGANATSATLDFKAVTRNPGSLVNFLPTATWAAQTASITEIVKATSIVYNGTAVSLPTAGSWKYVGAAFMVYSGGNTRYAQVDSNGQFGRGPNSTTWVNSGSSATTVYNGGTTNQTLTASESMYAILANNTDTQNMALSLGDATNAYTLTVNGMLHINIGSYTVQPGTAGGSLRIGSEKDLVINAASSGAFIIAASILDSTGGSSNVTVASTGTGLVTLSGNNAYTGQTYLVGGTTSISANVNLGDAATGASLNINNATLRAAETFSLDNGGANSRNVILANTATLDVSSTKTLTIPGLVSGTGTLTKTGAGSLVLTNANTYSGGTTVNDGVLFLNHNPADAQPAILGNVTVAGNVTGALRGKLYLQANNQLESTATVNAVLTGAAYADLVLGGNSQTIAGISATGTGVFFIENYFQEAVSNPGTLTINNSADVTLGANVGVRDGSSTGTGTLAIIKDGAGALTVGAGSVTNAGGWTLKNGAMKLAGNFDPNLSLEGGSLASNSTTARTLQGNLNIAADMVLGDATNNGTLTFQTGATTISGATRQLTVNSAVTIAQAIGDGGAGYGLTKTGAGTLTLSGNNTYSGPTTLSAGSLTVSHASGLGTGTAGTSIAQGATLNLANNITVAGEALSLASGSSGTVMLNSASGSNTWGGNITVTGGGQYVRFGASSGASLTVSGTLNNNGVAIVAQGDGATTFSNTISGSGGFIRSVTGAGLITLSGTNTYTGVTTISNGTLSVSTIADGGVACNLGRATSAAANLVLGGGKLQYTGATANTNRAFTLSSGANSTIEITSAGANLTISGAVPSTSGSLTKSGPGTLTLSGANAYTGATNVNEGMLLVNGSHTGGGLYTVLSGATLGGSGTVNANVTVDAGGFLSPGNSPGVFTINGNVVQNGTLLVQIDAGASPAVDLLNVSGTYDIGSATVDFNAVGTLSGDYVFADYGSLAAPGQTYASTLNVPNGYAIDYAYGGDTKIALVPIPEPATVAGLATLGLMGAAGWWWRRRKKVDLEGSKQGDNDRWYDDIDTETVLL